MTMHYITTKHKNKRYFIETDNGQSVAWFDSLDTAATVLRYLQGAVLDEDERAAAHQAMQAFDAGKEVKTIDTKQE